MSIELSENTVGIWAVNLLNESDWIGAIWRDGDNWIMEYRFRHYVDDKTFDSKDIKNWYRGTVATDKATEEDMIRVMKKFVEAMWKRSGGKRYEILMGSGGTKQMLADIGKWPMITMKWEPEKAG